MRIFYFHLILYTFEPMRIKIRAFGIAKDILSATSLDFEMEEGSTIEELKSNLIRKYPDFAQLRSLAFAINESYVTENSILHENDEVVLIPPVSGG